MDFVLQNSLPRIPHPSTVENRLRSPEKPPILLSKAGDIRAVINKDLTDEGKRLVLLTKTSQRLLPIKLSAANVGDDSNIRAGTVAPQVTDGTFQETVMKRDFMNDVYTASGILPANSEQDAQEANIDLEPECILGMEEEIVPDVDEDDQRRMAVATRVRVPATEVGVDDDIKPCIKEEIFEEECCSRDGGSSPPFYSDVDLPCADQAFVISRRHILEMVKFCSQCGSRIANRYYSDRADSLGVALICSKGHTVELSLGKQLKQE